MAARSLSLQAYRALARRNTRTEQDFSTPRPDGELVWIHLGSAVDLAAVLDLTDRLIQMRQGVHVMLTLPPEEAEHWAGRTAPTGVFFLTAPDEHPKSIGLFLQHWAPNLTIWVWGGLRPNLMDEIARQEIPIHLVSADTSGFDGNRDRWLPELVRDLVRSFKSATARNTASAQRLKRLGMSENLIKIEPRLRASGRLLPVEESDLEDMTTQLAGRPVWLAAQTRPEEWGSLLSAHRSAARGSHRLLLIIELAAEKQLAELLSVLNEHNMSYAIWGDGAWPEESMQVLVADLPGELGLWYRVATVSYLGGSLVPGYGGTDPLPAAALGTAVLYGPHVRHHLPRYTRLANAGGARIVNDAMSLAAAVSYLIAPDHAAKMAHAGWDVSSEGAEVTDRLIELIQDELDEQAKSS